MFTMTNDHLKNGTYQTKINDFRQGYNRYFIDFPIDDFNVFTGSFPGKLNKSHVLYLFFRESGMGEKDIAKLTATDFIGTPVEITIKNNTKDGKTYSNVVKMALLETEDTDDEAEESGADD
ncbi:MAG: hypothetical protein FWG69_03730 [Oscillospiraceae bacterium]|nr:hypothetical protein [Oscillospiraceae bacterium]